MLRGIQYESKICVNVYAKDSSTQSKYCTGNTQLYANLPVCDKNGNFKTMPMLIPRRLKLKETKSQTRLFKYCTVNKTDMVYNFGKSKNVKIKVK